MSENNPSMEKRKKSERVSEPQSRMAGGNGHTQKAKAPVRAGEDRRGKAPAGKDRTLREENPFRDPESLTSAQIVELSSFFGALSQGNDLTECCRIAWGNPDKWRRNLKDLFSAAIKLGMLELKALPGVVQSKSFKDRFSLSGACVVQADTTTEGMGRELFAWQAGKFFLERIQWLSQNGIDPIHIAIGGGESMKLLLKSLPEVLPSFPWFDRERNKIHLWTATVGHNPTKWWCDALHHTILCGDVLKIPQGSVHPLHGPSYLPKPEEMRQYRAHPEVRKYQEEFEKNVVMVVTSCGASPTNYCMEVLKLCEVKLPDEWVGEVLFNLFDAEGIVIPSDIPLFKTLADNALPERIRAAEKPNSKPFVSLGIVYGATKEESRMKSKALRAAIVNPLSRWFNYVVCTDDVAQLTR